MHGEVYWDEQAKELIKLQAYISAVLDLLILTQEN
jgi:hypothetical protein